MVTTGQTASTTLELLTIRDAAALLGTSRSAVHCARLYGRLDVVRVPFSGGRQGYRFLTTRESVEALRLEREARLAEKHTAESIL